MSLYDIQRNRVFGLVLGIVSDNQDPDKMGRVKVTYHMLDQKVLSDWCRVVGGYAGKTYGDKFGSNYHPKGTSYGFHFMPEVGDEVVIGFEFGDVNFPFVLGSVYNGKDLATIADNKNNDLKRVRMRSGHQLTISDKKDKESIELIASNEKITITIDSPKNTITVDVQKSDKADGTIKVTVPKGLIDVLCKDFKLKATDSISIECEKGPIDIKCKKAYTLKVDDAIKVTAQKGISEESKTADIKLKASTAIDGQATDVKFKGSASFEAKAAKFTVKADGMGEVKAGGPLTVKGAIVNIN